MKRASIGLVIGVAIGLFVGFLIATWAHTQSRTHHVLIAYPERWQDGDHRPCFLGPENGRTVDRAGVPIPLPQLDCDRFVQREVIHRTPPERIFALDVDFVGDFHGALEAKPDRLPPETPWTCQRIGDKIECKP